MFVLPRPVCCILFFLLLLNLAAQEQNTKVYYDFWRKVDKSAKETSSTVYDSLDFTKNDRIKSNLNKTLGRRLLCAAAAGKFAEKNFAGKIIAPILFDSKHDQMQEKEMLVFQKNAPSVQIVGPIYITTEGLPPVPDGTPTLEQMDKAMLEGIELRADAIVCFVGLPENKQEQRKMTCWTWNSNAPRLIFTDFPDSLLLKQTMIPCPVAAAILRRPFPKQEKKLPWYHYLMFWKEKPEAMDPFDQYFIMLSQDTMDTLLKDGEIILSSESRKAK